MIKKFFFLIAISYLLMGCGQSGDLYLPKEQPPIEQSSVEQSGFNGSF